MRRSIRVLILSTVLVCGVAPAGAAVLAAPVIARAQTGTERIASYDAGIAIQRNGSILVTERIAYDFGGDRYLRTLAGVDG